MHCKRDESPAVRALNTEEAEDTKDTEPAAQRDLGARLPAGLDGGSVMRRTRARSRVCSNGLLALVLRITLPHPAAMAAARSRGESAPHVAVGCVQPPCVSVRSVRSVVKALARE